MTTTQWHWMMDWCKKNMLHPGESWVWQAAEQAYIEAHKCVSVEQTDFTPIILGM